MVALPTTTQRTCMFCGSERELSREHVFAQWIDRLFPDLGDHDHVRRQVTDAGDDRHARPARRLDFVTKRICRNCNNGWMSELEARTEPVLTPMILDRARTLDPLEQHLVTVWATKTIMAVQALHLGDWRIAGEDVYHWFANHREPLPASHAWIARYGGRDDLDSHWPISVHQYGIDLALVGQSRPEPDDHTAGYSVVMAIGYFVVWLWGHTLPDGPATVGGSDDARLHIWPTERPARWPPPETLADDAALERVSRELPSGLQAMNAPPVGPP